ncbi:amidase [Mesorhizobium sp. M4B.F.Ca.ET.215.01.1.1]|uniref:amidase n=1 Tax=unclassified Mesorhizobium TaxID=325217 RepID=UPI000FCABF70|nr:MULTISPECIES: amidase [unclassified Mesorhizobium]RUW26486.1 amidase [Mesorhizobium sp. M4B.F.Ca.ET.013.02.1.1]RVD43946.1 amidase [Mesorhizobium sp. M4B.F.Ca.ET.019.03.1.1]TGQ15323.1 amidase [Mesorhizobium sp. M4B.F.Ca.ET.215.01.1.1]TGQ48468.1 amidase [Mesorhizobium sp. M00.F.Ca.ET.220.01.1.1]TGR11388.1 amidase [Mesorhizobium sp. M4B.F.Ca.ET.203.01.1.1]
MDIAFASTIDLATAIAARRISAVVALDAHLAQIDRGNGAVNAIVTLDREGARERARQADVALARGDALGPLHGVPFTLKDTHDTAGMKTTVGFPPFADYVAKKDSPVVARLKAAGAILIGKTNVATMLSDWQSDNPLFGRTGNPWNLSRTAGGSSGGAAAAVAAGMTPFEIGTDMQDSIRLPAAFCGVYGLKPTEHRVSLAGAFPDPGGTARSVRLMSCLGPLARSAEDLALIYRIIAGPDGGDTDLAPVPVEATETPDVGTLRIAVATTFPGFPVADEISAAVEKLGEKLGSAGAMVDEAKLPRVDLHDDLAEGGALIGMMLEAAQPDPPEQPTPISRWFAALARRDRSILAWDRFFESCDALLCPVAMTTAFPHCAPGTAIEVNGRGENYWMLPAYGAVFNYSGHPALTIPGGYDSKGLPIGLQLIGSRWSESRLLGIASAIAPLAGGFRRPTGY